jgi:hypothetical protein
MRAPFVPAPYTGARTTDGDGRSVPPSKGSSLSPREVAMGDKSPHDTHHSQKSAKSIKEKRAERKAKDQVTASQMARLAETAKRKG